MSAYYNENDPFAAQWLRNLVKAGHVANGEVDGRSIVEVSAEDVRGFTQAHFFAGIGVWSHALRLAGWGDERPVWTGSCPCQPFSVAGRREGVTDERHLWPTWFNLLRQCNPPIVFGEQVASKDGLGWLDIVSTDLEGAGYAVGAADLCAASAGAPHIRQRLWFVGHAKGKGLEGERGVGSPESERSLRQLGCAMPSNGLGNTKSERWERWTDDANSGWGQQPFGHSSEGSLANTRLGPRDGQSNPNHSFWSSAEWLQCSDGKARLAKPSIFPLAYGATKRMGRLRAYGNAICPQVAKAFIQVAMEYAP